jgi:hypothetical protein
MSNRLQQNFSIFSTLHNVNHISATTPTQEIFQLSNTTRLQVSIANIHLVTLVFSLLVQEKLL